MFRSARSAMFAAVLVTMLGAAAACKASDGQVPATSAQDAAASQAKYDLIGKTIVPLGDLDLDKPADARVLLKRLDRAAYQACGGNPKFHASYSMTPRRVLDAYAECQVEAVRRAVDRIGNPTLSRMYADSRRTEHPVAARSP